jgi:putative sterol carrier protein
MVDITIKDLIDFLPKAFIPENAKNTRSNIQIIATGPGGGEWGILIKDQKCEIKNGLIENVDFSLTAASKDIIQIFLGELDPMRAYMQGKIQFKGKIKQALALTKLFSTDKKLFEELIDFKS